jgi:hypothetical protein
MPQENLIEQLEDIKILAPPIRGLNLDLEPTQIEMASPYMKNFKVKKSKVVKRLGYVGLGLNNTLPGTGMDIFNYTDERGNRYLIALTTTDAAVIVPDTSGTYQETWLLLTPSMTCEDCEAGWTSDDEAITHDDTDYVRTSKSVKVTLAAQRADGVQLAHKDVAVGDITAYNSIGFWIKSSIALAANALEVVVSEDNDAAGEISGVEGTDYVIGLSSALTADTWTYCRTTVSLANMNNIVSVSLYANATIADATVIHLDDVRAFTPFTGDDEDDWDHEVVTDENYASFDVYNSALVITNGAEKKFFWQGDSTSDFFAAYDIEDTGDGDFTNFDWCKCVFELGNHVCIANLSVNSKQFVRRVAWADIGDSMNWVTSGTYGDRILTDSDGEIKAVRRLKKEYVIYSEGSISTFYYVSGDKIMSAETYIHDLGLFSPRAIWAGPKFHIILGTDKRVYFYYGMRDLVPVGEAIEETLFDSIDSSEYKHIVLVYNTEDRVVQIFFPGNDDEFATKYYGLNIQRNPMTWEYGEFYDSVRGMCSWRSTGGVASWRCDGPYLGSKTCSEMTIRCNASIARENTALDVFISDDGSIYSVTSSDGSDDGESIPAELHTEDVTIVPLSETLQGRTTEFSFNASSGRSLSSTIDLYYSTDEGASKTLIEASIALTPTWQEIRKTFDVVERKIRMIYICDHKTDVQIRAQSMKIKPTSQR